MVENRTGVTSLIALFVSLMPAAALAQAFEQISVETSSFHDVIETEILIDGINDDLIQESIFLEQGDRINLDITIPEIKLQKIVTDGHTRHKILVPKFVRRLSTSQLFLPKKVFVFEVPLGIRVSAVINEQKKDTLPLYEIYHTTQTIDTPSSPVDSVAMLRVRNRNFAFIEIRPVAVNLVEDAITVTSRLNIDLVAEVNPEATAYDTEMLAPIKDEIPNELNGTGYLEKYLIIVEDELAQNATLEEFVDWKKRKGYNVKVIRKSEIPSNGNLSVYAWNVKNYLRALSPAEYPAYLLAIGDDKGVPAAYSNSSAYSDWHMYQRTDDPMPDLYIGRVPARTDAELTSMLSKMIDMDRNPPNSNMYGKGVITGEVQDESNGLPTDKIHGDPANATISDNVADRGFLETLDAIASFFEYSSNGIEVIRAIVNSDGITWGARFNADSLLWNYSQIPQRIFETFISEEEARDKITHAVNQGVSFILHRDHGGYNGWGTPEYTSEDVETLENGENRPLILSINCLTGAYTRPSSSIPTHGMENFARSWLLHPNGGAHAVIGATDYSDSVTNDIMAHGIYSALFEDYVSFINDDALFDGQRNLAYPKTFFEGEATKLGEIMNWSKQFMIEYHGTTDKITQGNMQLFHLFGDPEADIRMRLPLSPVVDHPPTVSTNTKKITVNTQRDNMLVSLYSAQDNVHVAGYSRNGSVALAVDLFDATNQLSIVVSGNGTSPYESTIAVDTQRPLGDVNNDYIVDIYDAIMIAQFSGGMIPAGFNDAFGDVNCDGAISYIDALMVSQYPQGSMMPFQCY